MSDSTAKKNNSTWSERLCNMVGFGRRQRAEQASAAEPSSAPQPPQPARPKRTRKCKKNKSKRVPVKRACNAFTYFVKDQMRRMSEFSPENMRVLADKWKGLSEARRGPYEIQAAYDARRYKSELARSKQMMIKRPCNGYMLYITDFMKNSAKNFASVTEAISEGARQWKELTNGQKAPWMAMAKMASEEYAVAKERLDKKSQSVSKTAAALGRQKLAAAEAKAVTKTRLVTKAKLNLPLNGNPGVNLFATLMEDATPPKPTGSAAAKSSGAAPKQPSARAPTTRAPSKTAANKPPAKRVRFAEDTGTDRPTTSRATAVNAAKTRPKKTR